MNGLMGQGGSAEEGAGQQGADGGQGGEGGQGGNGGGNEGAIERPDWMPEDLWGENGFNGDAYEALKAGGAKAADLPADASAYVLPTIEGFDAEAAGKSPIFATLREGAFKAGLGQAGFDEMVGHYVTSMKEQSDAQVAAEMTALGANAKARITAVNSFITANLPKDEAEALAASLTSAKAVAAIEKLMTQGKPGGAGRGQPTPPPTRKSREEIDKLMATKAYSGREDERDPKVVKEVDDWFQAEYGKK